MWARTWKSFQNSEGRSEVCSFHCLADIAVKTGEDPKDVLLALYMEPDKMVPQEKAFLVVGSKAKGTMTTVSKIAFASKEEGLKFSEACGGKLQTFSQALQLAKEDLSKENNMIAGIRIKSGKIVQPADNQEYCSVCGMFPARYPQSKCQLTLMDKKVYHFCSTRCLFKFLATPPSTTRKDVESALMWVTDYPTTSWIGARTAYYVVGSGVQGPMGHEAFAFDKKVEAQRFAKEEGGQVLTFREMSTEKIEPKE